MSEEYVATDTDDTYFLGSIFCDRPVDSCNDNSRAQFCSNDCDITDETEWYIDLDVNSDPINFKIDSGADVTVISEDIYRRMPNRMPSKVVLNSPGGQLSNLGQFVARTRVRNSIISFKSLKVLRQVCWVGGLAYVSV